MARFPADAGLHRQRPQSALSILAAHGMIPKLGWLEYVLNTPSHHRVHHAANPEYLDHNYGGVFIIFDRLFGTFVAERDDLPCRYGLVQPLRSNNPVFIAFHEWIALARDLWHARSWRDRWWYLAGPPGWQPDQERSEPETPFDAQAPGLVVGQLSSKDSQLH